MAGAASCNAGNITAAHVDKQLRKGHLGAATSRPVMTSVQDGVAKLETELGSSHLGGSLGQRSWTAWGYS